MRLLSLALLFLVACGASQPSLPLAFVAASALPVVTSLREQTPQPFSVTGASSAQLARQILAGAPAHVFLSANQRWMNEVCAQNETARGSQRALLRNRIAFVRRRDLTVPDADWRSIIPSNNHTVAVAEMTSVPLGIYTAQVLERQGFGDGEKPGLIEAKNALETAKLVASGEADFGFVYTTDVKQHANLVVVEVIEENLHDPIIYYLALLDSGGRDLFNLLQSHVANQAFTAAGFEVMDRAYQAKEASP